MSCLTISPLKVDSDWPSVYQHEILDIIYVVFDMRYNVWYVSYLLNTSGCVLFFVRLLEAEWQNTVDSCG